MSFNIEDVGHMLDVVVLGWREYNRKYVRYTNRALAGIGGVEYLRILIDGLLEPEFYTRDAALYKNTHQLVSSTCIAEGTISVSGPGGGIMRIQNEACLDAGGISRVRGVSNVTGYVERARIPVSELMSEASVGVRLICRNGTNMVRAMGFRGVFMSDDAPTKYTDERKGQMLDSVGNSSVRRISVSDEEYLSFLLSFFENREKYGESPMPWLRLVRIEHFIMPGPRGCGSRLARCASGAGLGGRMCACGNLLLSALGMFPGVVRELNGITI